MNAQNHAFCDKKVLFLKHQRTPLNRKSLILNNMQKL